MTQELWMLIGAVVLLFVTSSIQVMILISEHGFAAGAGNRQDVPAMPPGLLGRAKRTAENNLYGLAMFAPVVLVAHAAGVSNANTVLGAQLFLYARIAYTILYLAGVPWLRTAAFAVSVAGIALVICGVAYP